MRKKIWCIVILCSIIGSLYAQDKNYVHFGMGGDYFLLNDRTVGDVPIKGITGSIGIGYDRISETSVWGVGFSGGFGFANTYDFPSINNRMADSYFFTLRGYYMHRVNPSANKWRVHVGGNASFQLYVQQILSFTNSEANYFSHAGLGPSINVERDIKLFKKDWTLNAGLDVDILAVVIRPSYTMPFVEDEIKNVNIATLNDYGNYATRIGLFRSMKNGNAMEIVYKWHYDFYSRENTVRHAMHSLSYILYFNL